MSPGTLPQTLALNLILGLLLFGAAGALAWPEAWLFLALFNTGTQATGFWLRRHDPALLAERRKTPVDRDQSRRDRAAMGAVFLLLGAWFALMGLDARRFGWSHAPAWVEAVGAACVLIAFYAWIGVLKANSFAASRVRLQPERGQTVATTGPYAIVRHPMYSFALIFLLGIPLQLGSYWGALGVALFGAALARRINGEETMLMDGLPGYRAYAGTVRFRLIPGVW